MGGFLAFDGLAARIGALLLAITAFCAASAVPAAAASELLGVRFGPGADATRIVFDLDGAPAYALSGEDAGAGRLIVDFDALGLRGAERAAVAGKGHVARYAIEPVAGGGARATFDFSRTARIKDVFVIDPSPGVAKHRLVIDLETADKAAFLASLPARYADLAAVIEEATAQPDAAVAAPAPADLAQLAPPAPSLKTPPAADASNRAVAAPAKIVVVIDPGHGGRDPGSQGQSGTLEKHVTLAAARELAAILKARKRYEVVLTREADDDKRIISDQRKELARRETLAREARADLFISLHADAVGEKDVRGASVYTLSDEGSERSARLARSEGDYFAYDLDLKKWDSLKDILLDKAQDTTMTESSRFAQLVIDRLKGKTQLLNQTHRKGDLRVLLAADVPAVLLEMAFMSNAKDEANLNSPVWRKTAMTSVADAIDAYFDAKGDSRHAALGFEAAK